MNIENHKVALRSSASIITRDGPDLHGPRLVADDAVAICVRAFASADIARMAASGGLNVPGAYLLSGEETGSDAVYAGESGNVARRLQEHAADPSKAWVREVFVLCGFDRRLDKAAVVHLQKKLSERIEEANSARLIKGVNPCGADLPPWRAASLDRMFEDAMVLLFDAGCRCIAPMPGAAAGSDPGRSETAAPLVPGGVDASVDDEVDEGTMDIGVSGVPLGVEEQILTFGNLWARGYQHDSQRFVVAAGSELRRETNPSANDHTRERREKLIKTGAAKVVDGTPDRLRLDVAVAFPSKAIAAKVLCGAHVGSEKWRPAERPCVIAR